MISIYDQTGRLVASKEETAFDNLQMVKFENLAVLPSGVYFYKIQSGSLSLDGKILKN